MNQRNLKDSIYKEMAGMTKALGNSHRLEILDLLAQGPVSVEYIASNTSLSVANASQHLQVLKHAKLAKTERKGKYIYYRLASRHVYDAWCSLRKMGFHQNAEINRLLDDYRSKRKHFKSISTEELIEKMNQGNVVIIDVRPKEEYQTAHIEQALSFPNAELHKRLKELPVDRDIVAYCRGPLCVMADEAVELLNKHGYKAIRLETGFPEWEANGLPTS